MGIKDIINMIDSYFSKDERVLIKEYRQEVKSLQEDIKELSKQWTFENEQKEAFKRLYEDSILTIEQLKESLKSPVNSLPVDTELKDKLDNNHHKRTNKMWKGVRLKDYCLTRNSLTPVIKGTSYDNIAEKALKYVHDTVKYTSEKKDYWQFTDETIQRGKGDCEDGAILLYNIIVKAGVPSYRVRLNAGDVKGGGHAYVTYYSDKGWVILDWCYWYNESKRLNKTWKDAEKYFGIWFSWNDEFVWENIKDGDSL